VNAGWDERFESADTANIIDILLLLIVVMSDI